MDSELKDWFDRVRSTLESEYLAAEEPWRQSGMSGPYERWDALRCPVAYCIDREMAPFWISAVLTDTCLSSARLGRQSVESGWSCGDWSCPRSWSSSRKQGWPIPWITSSLGDQSP